MSYVLGIGSGSCWTSHMTTSRQQVRTGFILQVVCMTLMTLLAIGESRAGSLSDNANNGSGGRFDVTGLTLEMTPDDALLALRQRVRTLNGKQIVFEVVKEGLHEVIVEGTEPRKRFTTLSDAKSVLQAFNLAEEPSGKRMDAQDPKVQQFIAGGQIEIFEFQFPNVPNDPRVTVVSRTQRLAPPVHKDTIQRALIKKYGPPSIQNNTVMIWVNSSAGTQTSAVDAAKCRGIAVPPGGSAGAANYEALALKGCGEQLTVQIEGALDAVMAVHTTLYHHQRLVDQREATRNAMLSHFSMSPEQTRQAPAPQF